MDKLWLVSSNVLPILHDKMQVTSLFVFDKKAIQNDRFRSYADSHTYTLYPCISNEILHSMYAGELLSCNILFVILLINRKY